MTHTRYSGSFDRSVACSERWRRGSPVSSGALASGMAAIVRFEAEQQLRALYEGRLVRVGWEHDAGSIRKIPITKLRKDTVDRVFQANTKYLYDQHGQIVYPNEWQTRCNVAPYVYFIAEERSVHDFEGPSRADRARPTAEEVVATRRPKPTPSRLAVARRARPPEPDASAQTHRMCAHTRAPFSEGANRGLSA